MFENQETVPLLVWQNLLLTPLDLTLATVYHAKLVWLFGPVLHFHTTRRTFEKFKGKFNSKISQGS